ncbi:MAG TPA: transketolase [Candidatus Eisenbacteria bacterium]|nr:transketolase [Candidatus Eisenbacteria bacterium]
MPATSVDLDLLAVQTIKFLSADAVERARSGHPGAPMGMADMAYALWSRHLRFDPDDPAWVNRDRFVLSAGHASMLLYSLLHLFECGLSLDEIRRFRQWESRTPGHPEFGHTAGVEATTGPLGQGFANAVGMGLAQRLVQARFPRLGPLLDHRVFAIVSDGDLMEGVSAEAAALAGHWKLGNLVFLYDDNRISIEGPTSLAWSEDVGARFDAYGWHTIHVDGQDRAAVSAAIEASIAENGRPSLVLARTTIGKGAPTKEGTAKAHGEPLGADELRRAKEAAGWPLEPSFHVPAEVRARFSDFAAEKRAGAATWRARFEEARRNAPEEAERWDSLWSRAVPGDLEDALAAEAASGEGLATRSWSGRMIQVAAAAIPSLIGGSADLAPSNLTDIKGSGDVAPEGLANGAPTHFAGRTLHFGVREHAMGSILNGLSLYGAWIPFGGTFLVFSDYMRPAIRLAALSGLRAIYVFTHDSVFLGEDGPTHQPIEQVASLRLIPDLEVWRPADGLETAVAWAEAIRRERAPTALVLSRQKLAPIRRDAEFDRASIRRGGYVVEEGKAGRSHVTLVASGSETPLALEARTQLESRGILARVVSVPCVERFEAQPAAYREAVLPPGGKTIVIEAARTDLWCAVVGRDALRIGIGRFGASAPAEVLAEKFGLTPDAVADRVSGWLRRG